jgi:hypothetical protein
MRDWCAAAVGTPRTMPRARRGRALSRRPRSRWGRSSVLPTAFCDFSFDFSSPCRKRFFPPRAARVAAREADRLALHRPAPCEHASSFTRERPPRGHTRLSARLSPRIATYENGRAHVRAIRWRGASHPGRRRRARARVRVREEAAAAVAIETVAARGHGRVLHRVRCESVLAVEGDVRQGADAPPGRAQGRGREGARAFFSARD